MTFKVTSLFILLARAQLGDCSEDISVRELTYYAQEKKESVRLYGNIKNYAYWYLDLLVGTPPQRTSVIVDTGSTVCAFACKACSHCGSHIDASFDVSASSSAAWSSCSSDCPSHSCMDGHCSYSVSYSEGSSVSGYWFTDVVHLGDGPEANLPIKSYLGCHTKETKLFYTQSAGGILGLAPGSSSSFPTILSSLFADERIDKRIFSLCMSSEGGELTVGGFDEKVNKSEFSWIPLRVTTFYELVLTKLRIGTSTLGTVFGTTIVDSGTTLTYFPENIFRALTALLDRIVSPHARKDGTRCWLTGNLALFPVIHIEFGIVHIEWKPAAYLYVSQEEVVCFAFEESGSTETILGASFFINQNVVFDLANKKLGIAAADCPRHLERPVDVSPLVALTEDPITEVASTVEPLAAETTVVPSFGDGTLPGQKSLDESPPVSTLAPSEGPPSGNSTRWVIWLFVIALSVSVGILAYRRWYMRRPEPETEQLYPITSPLPS